MAHAEGRVLMDDLQNVPEIPRGHASRVESVDEAAEAENVDIGHIPLFILRQRRPPAVSKFGYG